MTTPLSKLLTDLLTDPDGRAALGDDPAGVLADNGWGDLSPRDVGDALRVVTASGPASAAHAGAELPEQPTTWGEVVDPVLDATDGLTTWEADPGAPLVAGAIEPETFDFAPPPLVGVDPDLAADPHDDPFLRSDAERADAGPDVPDEAAEEPSGLGDAIDLGYDEALEDQAATADEAELPTALDDLTTDDGMTLRDSPGMDIADDLALPEEDALQDEGGVPTEGLDVTWSEVDPVDSTDVHAAESEVRDLDPFVDIDELDAAELDQDGPDHLDELD